jgi:hypothetical protein
MEAGGNHAENKGAYTESNQYKPQIYKSLATTTFAS